MIILTPDEGTKFIVVAWRVSSAEYTKIAPFVLFSLISTAARRYRLHRTIYGSNDAIWCREVSFGVFETIKKFKGYYSSVTFWSVSIQKSIRGNSAKKHAKLCSNGSNHTHWDNWIGCYRLDRQIYPRGYKYKKKNMWMGVTKHWTRKVYRFESPAVLIIQILF